MKKITSFLILIILLLGISIVFAAEKPKQKNDETLSNVDKKTMDVFMNQIEVYGRIAKPQTVFIIPGTDPRVDGIRIERRFFKDIFRSVEKSTLRKEQIKAQRNKDHILW